MDVDNRLVKILQIRGIHAANVDQQKQLVTLYVDPSFSQEDYERVLKFVSAEYGHGYKIDIITTPPIVML